MLVCRVLFSRDNFHFSNGGKFQEFTRLCSIIIVVNRLFPFPTSLVRIRVSAIMHFSTGDIISLEDCTYKHKLILIVEEKNKGQNYCFARPREPYHRLHVNQNGKVTFDNKQQNHGSFFTIVMSPTATTLYRIQTVATNVCIGVQPDGSLHSQSVVQRDNELTVETTTQLPLSVDFRVLVKGTATTTGAKDDCAEKHIAALHAVLQPWELRRFVSEGFLVIRNGVQQHVLERCTRKVRARQNKPLCCDCE